MLLTEAQNCGQNETAQCYNHGLMVLRTIRWTPDIRAHPLNTCKQSDITMTMIDASHITEVSKPIDKTHGYGALCRWSRNGVWNPGQCQGKSFPKTCQACVRRSDQNLPQYPVVMRNREKYRPPVAMVAREIIYPRITTHHQLAIWKNRSPDLSVHSVNMLWCNYHVSDVPACHALSTQQVDANTHGGLAIRQWWAMTVNNNGMSCSRCHQKCNSSAETKRLS